VLGCFFYSIALSDVVVNYGTVSLDYNSPGFAASDTFNLVAGDVELSFTINTGGVSGDWTYYTKVGLAGGTMYEGNFNGPDSTYGCIEMLVGDHQNSCQVDASEKFALKNSNYGEWESLYDAYDPNDIRSAVGLTDGNNTLGRFYNMWFDRGWYQWTSITPRTISGVNVDTNGIYHIKITYHAVDSNTATMFATINNESQGFYTQEYWDSHMDPNGIVREMPDVKPIGLSCHADTGHMRVFAGTYSMENAGSAIITDLTVKQKVSIDVNALADFCQAWLCSRGEMCFDSRFNYNADDIINFLDFAVLANNFTGQLGGPTEPPYPYVENCIQWKLDDNADNSVVAGNEVNAQLIDCNWYAPDYTSAVASTVNGIPAFHLNGSTQYVCVTVPNIWPSARANLWTKYSGNPVLRDYPFSITYGQLAPNPAGGWYFFGPRGSMSYTNIWRWESTDLITWSNPVQVLAAGGPGKWDSDCQVASVFQEPNNTWVMFYRGFDGAHYKIGKATSTDGTTFTRVNINPNNPGLFDQFGANYDLAGIILVDDTYYAYVNGAGGHGVQNIYTSTDLETFTAYAGNPIFPGVIGGGDFCSHIWYFNGYYYLLVCRDFNVSGNALYDHAIGLYRSKIPTFDANSRDFLGYPIVNDQTYDVRYLDTPSVPTTNIYRTSYPADFGDILYCLYSSNSGSGWANRCTESLASSTLTELAERTPKVGLLYGEKQSYSFWVQFDILTGSEAVFSVGSSPSDSSPVWLCRVKKNGADKVLALYLGGNYRLSTTVLSVNTPYHIVVVNEIDQVKMYINGQSAGFSYTQNNTAKDDNYLYIGAGYGSSFLDGYVWDFRIYPTALNITEVDRLYRTGSIN
jgi:hypothetical protein